jgi:hypothetical protein
LATNCRHETNPLDESPINPVEMATLAEALEQLAATPAGFEHVFKTVEFDWSEGAPLKGVFAYPSFNYTQVDVDAVVDFLDRCLVDYCIPRTEVAAVCPPADGILDRAALAKLREAFSALKDRARKSFIRSRSELKKGGEAGELILYCFLERLLKAPQLVSKMNLKTSGNQSVFGRDGIHISFDDPSKSLILWLGESKLDEQFSDAASRIIESVLGYLSDLELREHEINVIRSHADYGEIPDWAKSELRALINPYSGGPPKAGNIHACLLGFQWEEYSKILKLAPEEIESAFKGAYLVRIKSGCQLLKSKVDSHLPADCRLIFFLLPFPSLATLRKIFAQKLGMNDA